jgi:hypothetical protein
MVCRFLTCRKGAAMVPATVVGLYFVLGAEESPPESGLMFFVLWRKRQID